MKLEMKSQDMEELFQLLQLYERTYGGRNAVEMLGEVAARYREKNGEGISCKRNPRGAGRKRRYPETARQQIRELREEGLTIRRIAEKTGYSVGYVQGVLSEPMKQDVQ